MYMFSFENVLVWTDENDAKTLTSVGENILLRFRPDENGTDF